MDGEHAKQVLRDMLEDNPRDVAAHILHDSSSSLARVCLSPVPTFCLCGQCTVLDKDVMNVCCNHTVCITSQPTFHDLCLNPSVLEVAGVLNYCDQFHDEPVVQNSKIRNQAYRFFILWQFGKLGRGNRRCPPSCVVSRIRWKFPDSDGLYTGYESVEELDID